MGLFDRFRSRPRDPVSQWPPRKPKRKVTRITRQALRFISETARATHPHEFAAGLRAEKDTVIELVFVPTQGGPVSAHMQLWSLPVDRSVVGTVHSHPGSIPEPSDADLELFSHFGHTHIIIAEPYGREDWLAYDHYGHVIELEIV